MLQDFVGDFTPAFTSHRGSMMEFQVSAGVVWVLTVTGVWILVLSFLYVSSASFLPPFNLLGNIVIFSPVCANTLTPYSAAHLDS